MPEPKSPNILLILSDQQRWDTLGVLNPKIQTPNLDRLATEGTHFERAYAPTPVCLPCRASLLTGQYPSRHGAAHNDCQLLPTHSPLIADTLRRRGYYTHIIGKSHLSTLHDSLSLEAAPHIYDFEYFRRWHGPWYGFEHADINIAHSTEKHAASMHYGAWLKDRGVDTSQYFGHTTYTQYGAWDLPEEHHSSAWVAETTIRAMSAASDEKRPFFLYVNFQDPHNPCMVPEPWASMYDPEALPRFGYKTGEPGSFATKPPFYREITERPGCYLPFSSDPGLPGGVNVAHLPFTDRQTQENAACYYGMISLMDKYVGRILDALDVIGQADNTLVVFASDHGDLLGDHGFWWKSLACFEEALRVPMLARLPGRIPAGKRARGFQSLIDLYPTFCSYAGAPTPYACEGANQVDVWEGRQDSARDSVIIEDRPFSTDFCQRIIITDTHKLCFYSGRPFGELYDLAADPDHIKNLWDEPACRDLKEDLIRKILSHEMIKARPTPKPSRVADELKPLHAA